MVNLQNKKAAVELSISTIIIIVLGVTMLILGMVLVRNIMCKTINLTTNIDSKVTDELNRYFGDSGSEVACMGAGGEAVKLLAGKTNYIFCIVKAPATSNYQITLTTSKSYIPSLKDEQLKGWIKTSSWTGNIAPGDQSVKKPIMLQIPSNAPEGPIKLQVEVKKDNGMLVATQDLDFEISRVGFVSNAIC
jgi:hypothetical protein